MVDIDPPCFHSVKAIHEGFVRIRGDSLRIVTDRAETLSYLAKQEEYLPRVGFLFSDRSTDAEHATLVYLDRAEYRLSFDPSSRTLCLEAPWASLPGTSMLRMSMWLLTEYLRQSRGEYVFHASAVVRDGQAVVFNSPAQGGKTTVAMELCRHFGYRLFANDQLVIGIDGEVPFLRHGDPAINCRLSSLLAYDPELASRIFGDQISADLPWHRKRLVAAEELGIELAQEHATPLTHFVLLTLDKELDAPAVEPLKAASLRDLMQTKIDVFSGLASLIRGGSFAPFRQHAMLTPMFVPSLDTAEFAARRIQFVESLFDNTKVVRIRGQLSDVARYFA